MASLAVERDIGVERMIGEALDVPEDTHRTADKKGFIFIVCPVRDASEEIKAFLESYVATLESEGYQVHYPPRDTEQDDPSGGVNICETNCKAMLLANEIHVYFNPDSSGTHFDFGAFFMLVQIIGYKKKIVFINKDNFTQEKSKKSFTKVLAYLHENTKSS